jgi:hypothetical protein
MSNGVIAVEKSSNSKIGAVSTTYVSQESCPKTCPFMGSGCYAESGMVAMHTNRLNKSPLKALDLAKAEAQAINTLSGKRDMRLHIVGDCTTNSIAKIVSKAADKYKAKHHRKVWSYTHAWAKVERSSWNSVSVLASTETTKDAKLAIAKGYAAAIVVHKHKDTKVYMQDGLKIIPCPQQNNLTTSCETCKLCWDDQRLLKNNMVIAFATHSQGKTKIDKTLTNIVLSPQL